VSFCGSLVSCLNSLLKSKALKDHLLIETFKASFQSFLEHQGMLENIHLSQPMTAGIRAMCVSKIPASINYPEKLMYPCASCGGIFNAAFQTFKKKKICL